MPYVRRAKSTNYKRKSKSNAQRYSTRPYRVNTRNLVRWGSKVNPSIHSFKRKFVLANGIYTNITPNNGYAPVAYSFNLAQVPSATDFTNMFDQYRINLVVLRVMWRSTNVGADYTASSGAAISAPYVIHIVDRDDVTTPTANAAGANTLREYAKSRQFTFDTGKRELVVKFVPNSLVQNFDGVLTTSYTLQYKKWIDMADGGTTPHYGWKAMFICPAFNSLPNISMYFDIEATLYFQCRDVR